MICPVCGKEYDDEFSFCTECGAKLAESINAEDIAVEPEVTNTDDKYNDESNDNIKSDDNDSVSEPINNDIFMDSEQSEHHSDVVTVKSASAMGNFLSVIMVILIFAFTVLSITTFCLRQAMQEQSVTTITEKNDVLYLPVSEFDIVDDNGNEFNNDVTVLDSIYEMTSQYGLTKNDIVKIYESEPFQEFLKENLNGMSEYFLNGYTDNKISADVLKELYTDNSETINEILGIELTDKDVENVYKEIDNLEPVINMTSVNNIESSKYSGAVAVVRTFVSLPALILETVFVILLIILLMSVQKRVVSSFMWTGIPLVLSGIVLSLGTLLISSRLVLYYSFNQTQRFVISSLCELAEKNMYIFGLSVLFAGVVLISVSTLIRKKKKAV